MAADRRTARRRRLADLRRQLRRGVDGDRLAGLLSEAEAAKEALAACQPPQRARKAAGHPPPARMRVKPQPRPAQRDYPLGFTVSRWRQG